MDDTLPLTADCHDADNRFPLHMDHTCGMRLVATASVRFRGGVPRRGDLLFRTRISSQIVTALAIAAGACADPPVDLPPSSPFPYNVQLGMTFHDLRRARPGIWLEPDSGWVLEEHTRGRFQYAFTGNQWPPARQSRLIYVHRVDEELSGDYAADRWDTLADSMALELNAEPGCASIAYGRLVWQRAMFREAGGQLEAAVELQITTIGDAGPGVATLITRIWLAEYAAPVAHFLEAPRATARGQLPDWAPCEEPAAEVPRM